MYNFSVSSQLKAWFERVLVAGKTFRYTENGVQSLLPKGKKAFIASSRGGIYEPGRPAAAMERHETYLKAVLGFIGLHDVAVVRAEGVALGADTRAAAIANARGDIAALTA